MLATVYSSKAAPFYPANMVISSRVEPILKETQIFKAY